MTMLWVLLIFNATLFFLNFGMAIFRERIVFLHISLINVMAVIVLLLKIKQLQ